MMPLAAYGAYEAYTQATKPAASPSELAQRFTAMEGAGIPLTAESALKAAGVASPTSAQISRFGALVKATPGYPSLSKEQFAAIALQVSRESQPAVPTAPPAPPSAYGPPSAPPAGSVVKSAPSGGGGGGLSTVAEAQQILASLGFNPGKIDGVMGPNTASAIRAFQTKEGLPATGTLDAGTLAKLRAKKSGASAAAASSKGMSTGLKVGLALAGAAVIGGGLWYFMQDEEPGEV